MKKFMAISLLFAWVLTMPCCGKVDNLKPHESSEEPYYFIGEIIGEHPFGGLVRVVDYGNCTFSSAEVYLKEVRSGSGYSVGDYIRVEFNGLFLETAPPQIKSAISIENIDAP